MSQNAAHARRELLTGTAHQHHRICNAGRRVPLIRGPLRFVLHRTLVPLVLLSSLLLSGLLLGGCSNNPYPNADSERKIYYTVFSEAPRTLDPATAYTTTSHAITGKVYDTLLEYHYLKRPFELIPGLAEAVPKAEHLPNGQVRYTFAVRRGMLFQEDACFSLSTGKARQIVAADFAFELMRIADPEVNSPVIEPFSNLLGLGEFSKRLVALRKKDKAFSKRPVREQYARAGGIEGVRAKGKYRLELTLVRPYPQILYWFAMPFTTPVPWEAVEYYRPELGRVPFSDHPVASGPFMLTSYDKQARIVLVKNPNWYGAQHPEWKAPGATYPTEGEPEDERAGRLDPRWAGKPLPFISRVEFRREKESIPAFSKFLQGYYDSAGVIRESFNKVIRGEGLSPDMVERGMRLDKSVVPAIYYTGFNMDDPVVGRKGGERSRKLRKAMSLVIDSKEYARLFMNGRGVPAQSVLPPGIFGYSESYKNPFRQVNIERAKRLLREAGYPGGIDPKTQRPLRLTLDVGDTSQERQLRDQFFVSQWRKIGLDVRISATNYNKFQEKVRDGAYQIFQWGWVADYPDPENFMFLLWSEMARSKNQGPNTANFSNPEFDRLFLQMKTMENTPERLRIIQKMLEILEHERPWIEMFYPEDYVLFHGWLHNVKPAGLSIPTTKYYDLEPEKRAELRSRWNKPILWPAYVLLALFAVVIAPGVRTFFKERV